ncbi:low molecular weight protein-tyrosine-phosphatase [Bacillus gobiensis]|uniref:low molecular weight protein-tyrosine-phosphatase n=1 Tax=Bacillus gobiensis TaxID=1441095 RepID=UPI003D20DD5C
MIEVLFICLGNICRSPMAEAVFRDLVKKKGLEGKISVDSAGTGSWHVGNPPHEGTSSLLKEKGINTEGMAARVVAEEDLEKFDYLIAMDAENISALKRMARNSGNTAISRLLDLVDESETKDVPDPYYTGNFEEVYSLVTRGCEKLLDRIVKEHNL